MLKAFLYFPTEGAVANKFFQAPEIKLLDESDSGSITGYASTFGNWDSVNERPVRGAFEPHLSAFLKSGFVAIGHDWNKLEIAVPIEAREDEHGLFVKAEFHDTPEAQAARSVVRKRLARDKDVGLSIGYEVLADEYTKEGRLLKEIKLYEWSLVTVPANDRAVVTGAKGLPLDGMTLVDHSEAVLAANEEVARRWKAIVALLGKDGKIGKPMSAARLERFRAFLDSARATVAEMEAMLEELEPKTEEPKNLTLADSRQLRAVSAQLRRRAHEIGAL